ncbi:MAG: hypothetical protein FJ137_03895 [Deltaproteobacteria bacterium]|nr:hypothetical protein [Deltaproteobacteria bacterium]
MRAVIAVVAVVAQLASAGLRAADWEEAARTEVDDRPLVVHARARAGSEVKEVRGVGSFDAPSWVIKNVIDDVARYQEFMPYTQQSPVLARGDGWLASYQRLHVPFIDDRDYVVKIVDESVADAQGRVVWKNRWTQANHLGPPPVDGVTRIEIVEGWWLLEEQDGGARTKATYYVYTSPGGAIPAGLVNLGNARGVPDLFRAVAKAARDPRYRAHRPKPRHALPKASPSPVPRPFPSSGPSDEYVD